MSSNHYDSIVIGLGASGTAAVSTLARAGRLVLALEAQDCVGGRVKTVPFGEGLVELGAEWIHGEKLNGTYEIAMKNNIAVVSQKYSIDMFRSDGSRANDELFTKLLGYCIESSQASNTVSEPLGQFLTKKVEDFLKVKKPDLLKDKDFMEQLLEFLNLIMNNINGSNHWDDVSTTSKFEMLEGDQLGSWHKYGYKTLFEILLNKFNNGPGLPTLEIKLNTEVSQISWPRDPKQSVRVTCTDGAVYTADNVIVTVSLGVLKESYKTLFSPKLTKEKVTAIEKISMGVMDKVILSFDKPWWPQKFRFNGFLWKGEDKAKVPQEDHWTTKIYGASNPMGSNNSITLWTSGEVGKLVETLPEDVVKTKCVQLLRKFMGANLTIPEPTGIIRSTWYSNRFTRGSYSFGSLVENQYPDIRDELATPLTDSVGKPRVLFAGEATHASHFSTVHGALETGYREAMILLANDE